MSEFRVQVVRIGKVGKHPNADGLSITSVSGRPVIFNHGLVHPGDLAVFVPSGSVVDTTLPWFNWLGHPKKDVHLVKVKKLRGIPSYGFFVPIREIPRGYNFKEGQDVRTKVGAYQYISNSDVPIPYVIPSGTSRVSWFQKVLNYFFGD